MVGSYLTSSQKPMDSQKRDDVDVLDPKNTTIENHNYNENGDSDSKSSSDTLNDRYNSNLDLDMTENEVESLKYNETYDMDFENENLETLDERLHSKSNGVDAAEICTLENEDARDLRLTFVHHDIVGNVENIEDLNESQRLMSPHVESVCSDRATSPVWQESGMSRDRMKLLASEERVKELQERLQAVSMQHNSLASSHRNLSMQHSELQSKTNSLEAEIIRLQEALKTSTEQIQRHLVITEQLRETNNTLQTQLQAERSNRKAAVNQEEQQKRTIQDLQRQVREMERILARKHPDSVSALIVASKAATTPVDDTARKLLEDRIVQLENAAKTQSSKSQTVLQTVQEKFNAMQLKYEAHIADLESQVFSLQQINLDYQQKEINGNKLLMDTEMQTDLEYYEMNKIYVNSSTQTMKPSPKIIPNKNTKQNLSHNQVAHKEDTHLLATIRGLNLELSGKDKSLQKMTRELEDCKKTIKRLQRDREVVLKSHPQDKLKEYDPQQFTVNGNEEAIHSSRTFELLQRDYHALVEKRLQDLNTLQHAHERELAGLEGTIDALRTRLRERDATISSLKGQIKAKVAALEKRHADREKTLKTLVTSLGSTKNTSGWIKL